MLLSRALVRLMLEKRRHIPQSLRDDAVAHALDNFGIAMAASRKSPVAAQVLSAFGGYIDAECGVIGRAARLPAISAAFVNSALAHIMDYDDSHDVARVHPTTPALAAALAAGEFAHAKGSAVLDGLILGSELICRLGAMCKPLGTGRASTWLLSQLFGYFGACLAAGVALGLSEDEIVSGFGIAYMQLAGGKESLYGTGATSRGIYTGFAAQGGMQAALLARAGVLGPESCFEGTAGVFPIYLQMEPSAEELQMLLAPDGWSWDRIDMKPWPCCRSSHAFVSVALGLHDPSRTARIERVRVAVNARAGRLCQPVAARQRPATLADAKYSIPFLVAFALTKGRVDLRSLNEGSIADADVLAVAQKVETRETLEDKPGHAPAHIKLELDDGSTVELGLTDSLRLEVDQVSEKFVDCMTYAGLGHQARTIWTKLLDFDHLAANEILSILHGTGADVGQMMRHET